MDGPVRSCKRNAHVVVIGGNGMSCVHVRAHSRGMLEWKGNTEAWIKSIALNDKYVVAGMLADRHRQLVKVGLAGALA